MKSNSKGPPGLMLAIGVPKGGGKGAPPGPGPGPDGAGPDDAGAPSGVPTTDTVPLDALAMPDAEDGDQMANPQVGDPVTYTVEGHVASIDGDNATVTRDSINGKSLEGPGDSEPSEDPSQGNQDDQADQNERGALGGMADTMGHL